jgi:hypothetical protein
MKNKNKSLSTGSKEAIGLGIAALAATAAGAYYLYGSTKGKAHLRAVKSWMLKAKADVMDEIGKMKEVNEDAYNEAIAKVAKKYEDIKGMDRAELVELVSRLQGHWKDIKREIEKAGITSRVKRPASPRSPRKTSKN